MNPLGDARFGQNNRPLITDIFVGQPDTIVLGRAIGRKGRSLEPTRTLLPAPAAVGNDYHQYMLPREHARHIAAPWHEPSLTSIGALADQFTDQLAAQPLVAQPVVGWFDRPSRVQDRLATGFIAVVAALSPAWFSVETFVQSLASRLYARLPRRYTAEAGWRISWLALLSKRAVLVGVSGVIIITAGLWAAYPTRQAAKPAAAPATKPTPITPSTSGQSTVPATKPVVADTSMTGAMQTQAATSSWYAAPARPAMMQATAPMRLSTAGKGGDMAMSTQPAPAMPGQTTPAPSTDNPATPADPTKPDPTDTTPPADQPTGPTTPVTTDPGNPTTPTDPADPTDPTKPIDLLPSDPTLPPLQTVPPLSGVLDTAAIQTVTNSPA